MNTNTTLKFAYTREQYNALDGLAYRIADNAYMIERYGFKETETERAENHQTIVGLLEKLDYLQVPFWVQNSVIVWAENWRKYKSEYMSSFLKTKNIVSVA